jgi:tetratricopeptide (TPR) repeat protein
MRNWIHGPGVYCNMLRLPLFLACALVAVAQLAPQQDPLDTAIQRVWRARNNGSPEEAVAARDQARVLLQRVPVDSPRLAGWAQQVMQLYQNSGLNGQARAILQETLSRTGTLPDWHPSRITMLSTLADSWQQEGNLLKAVDLLEQVAAAQAAAPAVTASQPAMRGVIVSGIRGFCCDLGGYLGSGIDVYIRLADLYQQLGRPDATAAVVAKMRTIASNDGLELAGYFEQQGQLEEAAAIYKKLAEQSADVQAKANGWQSLANIYSRQQHYADAVDAIQQAIALVQSSNQTDISGQAIWLRQNLAGTLCAAGLLDQADQVYQQLLQESRGGPLETQTLGLYASYLAGTQRSAEGESLLKDYLAGNSNLDASQRINVLFNLGNLAGRRGDERSSREYQQAAQALQPQAHRPAAEANRAAKELQNAQAALNERRLDDAFALALHAIDEAAPAADWRLVQINASTIAGGLAANKEPAKAERLFQRLFEFAKNLSAESAEPLIVVTQNYARFLMNQPDRLGEVPFALEQLRNVLIDANGPDSGSLAEPLRMKIEFERSHAQWQKAETSAGDLLELQEPLSGKTSEPYLGDLLTAAGVYQTAGDFAGALPLFRNAVTIADLFDTLNDGWRRSQTRMDEALALAHLGRFDEAESLGEEAIALQQPMPMTSAPLDAELAQIRQMKRAVTVTATRTDK